MSRRTFIKTVASILAVPSISPVTAKETDKPDLHSRWDRVDNRGYLTLIDPDNTKREREFAERSEWVWETVQALDETKRADYIVDLFDFDMISLFVNSSHWRANFAHEKANLEASVRQDDYVDSEYLAVVYDPFEPFEDRRIYKAESSVGVVREIKRERDENI